MPQRTLHIESVMRTSVGGVLITLATLLHARGSLSGAWWCGAVLGGVDLVQSGFTRHGLVEWLLGRLGLRSELDEVREQTRARTSAEAWAAHLETLDLLHEVVVELAVDGTLLRVSERWSELFGPVSLDVPRSRLSEQVHPEDRAALESLLQGLGEGRSTPGELRFRTRRPDGREHWLEGRFIPHRQEGRVRGLCGVLRDVTDSYIQERRISHMAMHDALTGLPNRLQLESRVDKALEQARLGGHRVALFFLDLDNFKQINDLHGHKVGDELLLAVSMQMRGCLPEETVLARWGGDEFVVLLPVVHQLEQVRHVAERLQQSIRELPPEDWGGDPVTASLGGAVVPDDAASAEALFIQADNALFFAKSQGRDNIQLHSDMGERGPAYRDFDLTSRLVRAIRQGLMRVHYQPVVEARSGEVVGVEALARWSDEKYGQVGPDTFIPMAEELGLIRELGELILEQSLAWFSEHASRDPSLCLSLNVSNRQQVSADFACKLIERVRQYGLRPEQVKLEITESIAMEEVASASRFLKELSEEGFQLSIDDFGTGFSSLSQLHALPVDELKIDRSFVRRLRTREGRAIVKAIVDMAHHLDLELVAEGVEDEETAELLRALGVERLQGFHFSRPLPAQECERFLHPLTSLACAM